MVELKKPQIKWTDEKKEILIKNYPNGDKKELCEIIGCSYKSLKSMARILGVKSLKIKNLYKLEKLTIENSYNYYWWGYILADGHINERNQLSITIKESDGEHLEKLSKYLNIRLNTRLIKTEYKEGLYSTITCQDVKYGVILKNKLGITRNKTYECINYNWINTEEIFISTFIGFYDGDGCLSRTKIGSPLAMKIECHENWESFFNFCKLKLKEYYEIDSKVYLTSRKTIVILISKRKNLDILYNISKKYKLPLLYRKWK